MNLPAALAPFSPEGGAVASLIWSFTGLCGAIWLLVVVVLYIALYRRRPPRPSPLDLSPAFERRSGLIVASLAILTGVIVAGLTVISYAAQQRLYSPTAPAVNIEITGHQWWWEAKYSDPDPTKTFVTANELHIPVGRLVRLELTSGDVIHSFWVPSLMGKADLIPGRHNELSFTAEKPGVYGGQCAEFCGLQHAHMGIRVFADPPDQYEAWRAQQTASAAQPSTPEQQAGQQAFTSNACVSCHTIRGTPAGGTLGPELTHLASRSSLAAVTADLNRGTLAAWVTDPQSMKPGTNMPAVKLEPGELNAIVTYLMGLK